MPGGVTYIPCNLGEIPDYYRRFIDRVDIAIMKARADGCGGLLQPRPAQPLAPGGDRAREDR